MQGGGGGGSRGVGDIFVGSASVFILLGRTSEINSPKTSTPKRRSVFYLFFGEFIDLFFAVILGTRYERGLGDSP